MENYQNNNGQEGNYYYSREPQSAPNMTQPNYQQNYGQVPEGNPPYYQYPPAVPHSNGNYPPQGQLYYQRQEMPEEISMWKYLGMMWVTAIPLVGIILILIWAFSNEQINRRNYARAILLNIVITAVIGFALWGVLMAFFIQLMDVIEQQQMYMR